MKTNNQKPKVEPEQKENFATKPRSLTILFICVVGLAYFAFKRDYTDSVANVKVGIAAATAIFLVYSILQMKDGLFTRPHPAFWRGVMGLAVLYLVFMVWLLFQSPHDARQIWTYFDPKLGRPLPERDYATDCRIYTPENPDSKFANIKATLLDEFVVAHLVGWFGKAFLFRDVYICWIWSLLFELCEISLSHVLPNFRECWWDQVILDVLLCNGIGIYLGHYFMYKFNIPTFNWGGIPENTEAPAHVRAFWPYKWAKSKWKMFTSAKRFYSIIFLMILAATIELNCFFLKYVLWHPPPHALVLYRLLLMYLFCLPALRELYEWVDNPDCKKLGTMAWLSIAILCVEVLVWVKFSEEMMSKALPTPNFIIYGWTFTILAIFVGTLVYFFVLKKDEELFKKNGKGVKAE